ncbi:signal peptidase I [candidate division KSB1 bacterium 4572_119]|nr:MAG: signal peptidase I [candidate division KSB1 bacterium 4572_119]
MAKVQKKKQPKNIVREYIEAILVALIAAFILRIFVVQAFRIPTGSMKDTLLVGDFLLVNKFIYGVRTPDRIPLINVNIPHFRLPAIKDPKPGEIIVFKYPLDEKLDYIKRCIAVGGQTVELKNGIAYVDGKPEGSKKFVKRKYDPVEGEYINYYKITKENGKSYTIRHYERRNPALEATGPWKVPEGYLFGMGDNRDNSADSRSWGFIPRENILGQALIIYFSWDHHVPLYKLYKKIRFGRLAKLIK